MNNEFFGVGLFNPKNNYNVGSVLRACYCFSSSFLAITGKRYSVANTDVCLTHKKIPLFHVEDLRQIIPYGCVPIAIEITDDASCITEFKHPSRAYYIFGPEDGSLGTKVTSWCKETISIPTKQCLNLAACVNVVLYDRMLKSK